MIQHIFVHFQSAEYTARLYEVGELGWGGGKDGQDTVS